MLNLLKKIWQDVRKGENIDLYLTIIAGLALAVTNLLGFAPDKWLAPVTLAILALLAISNLGNRFKLEMLLEQKNAGNVFLDDYPQSLTEEILHADELWMVGVNLHRTLYANPWINGKLKNRQKIKVLLVDPKSNAVKYVVARNWSVKRQIEGEKKQKQTISDSLKTLSWLMNKYPGFLEVRIINYPISVGSFALDFNAPKGVIYVELYGYKMSERADMPKFCLKNSDGVWYEHYKQQILSMWENATPFVPT